MEKINITNIANWLFGFYFSSTIILAFLLLVLGPKSQALSLSDLTGVWAIVIPVFIGQLLILYQWFIKESQRDEEKVDTIRMTKWILYSPPIAVLLIILVSLGLRVLAVKGIFGIEFTEDSLKIGLSLAMSILNATTIALNIAIFKETK